MTETIDLTTGQVVTICTGILACDIGELYEALDGLVGDPGLMTRLLPSAARAVEQHVGEHCPWVTTTEVPDFSERENVKESLLEWLAGLSFNVGARHPVPTIPEVWVDRDALQDPVDIRLGSK